jgi:hypothetical protein
LFSLPLASLNKDNAKNPSADEDAPVQQKASEELGALARNLGEACTCFLEFPGPHHVAASKSSHAFALQTSRRT